MYAIALRAAIAVALVVAAVLVLLAPWRDGGVSDRLANQPAAVVGADGEPLEDDGSYRRVPGMDDSAPHELVRYQMPEPSDTPALPEGVRPLKWRDLWADGTLTIDAAGKTRIGTPGKELFPEGTTAEDVMLFFLDLEDMRSLQPQVGTIRPELDGERVRLAGYTTPVGFGEDQTSFLLVPELGACIHVPPPPPNQIVYVEKAEGEPEMFEPVWVTGTLRADPVPTILADVGYRLEDVVAEPYR
jgi:hypothetical protein